ncbi:MAG UNVERIFIED_CONTAM: hypothetical protein LVR18_43170 [Planctomycetaceae bacterium]
MISAWYKTTDLLPVDGGKQILRFEARYVVWRDADAAVQMSSARAAWRYVERQWTERLPW